jgi:DNA repair protein RadC
MTITQLAPEDRPREKYRRAGPESLGDNELLAIIIGNGRHGCNALELANAVLAEVDGLRGLTQASYEQLCRRKGVGGALAVRIGAAVELGRRTLLSVPPNARPQIMSSRDAAALLTPTFGARSVEHFGVLLLDIKHRVLRTLVLTTGTSDGTYVDPRQVFEEALAAKAKALIAFHNHPSGDPTPSADDLALTRRLQAVGEMLGIEVLDHVIVANERYYSFKESLPPPAGELVLKQKRRV